MVEGGCGCPVSSLSTLILQTGEVPEWDQGFPRERRNSRREMAHGCSSGLDDVYIDCVPPFLPSCAHGRRA